MKKTLVRIVALVLLAVMILSVIPAFASGFVGTLASPTKMYQKPNTSSELVATVQGSVSILYQNNEGTMYQVTVEYNGKTYTGWVPAGAVTNIGRSGTTTGTTTTTTTTTTGGTYSGTLAAETSVYDDSSRLVGTVKGKVTVNYRNANGTQIHITATDGINTISGWVNASAISGLYSRNSGSIKVDKLPTSGAGSTAVSTDAVYTKYTAAKTGVSTDSTIYIRPKAEKSTSGATKIRNAKGLSFTLLGESGDFYYASYNGTTGFVRKQDFTVTTGTTTTTTTTGTTTTGVQRPTTTYPKAKAAVSNDRTIYMRYKPDKSTEKENVVLKVTGARGASFSLLGESGDWYLARYTQNGQNYEGYVRKQDFTVTEAVAGATTSSTTTSGATSVGTGSSSEKWGSFSVPGGSTYGIYGNYTNSSGTLYYYDYSNIGNYNYLHTTTAKGSQVHVVMGHNMRSSKSMFHRLHHVQNAILGAGSCEGCGGSCGSSYNTTTISASLDGYNTWDIMCFYEIPKGSSTSILEYNARPWNSNTQSFINYQLSYARTSGYKGWVNPSVSYSSNGKYMLLITCGDKYESSSNATSKLYMLLKARG